MTRQHFLLKKYFLFTDVIGIIINCEELIFCCPFKLTFRRDSLTEADFNQLTRVATQFFRGQSVAKIFTKLLNIFFINQFRERSRLVGLKKIR